VTIPDFQSIMYPFLLHLKDGKEYLMRNVIDQLAIHFKLSPDELKELLPSGHQAIFDNRVGWARTYLKKAGLLDSFQRGYIQISKLGQQILEQQPDTINVKFLKKFDSFKEFHTYKQSNEASINQDEEVNNQTSTPRELLEYSYQQLQDELAQEILTKIMSCSPQFFENLVVELMVKMGYGGSRKDAGQAIGKTGDGGIDGIIKEDKLGLDFIYIQAKRWEGTIGRPEIQKFVGALQGRFANKGVFITTSGFSKDALEYVRFIQNKVVLINGEQLTQLMIDYNLGVSHEVVYEVKKLDFDYFIDE
jgi:restriction system protein